jgi:ParB family transcriptional regulator, chromosome partitioning protein
MSRSRKPQADAITELLTSGLGSAEKLGRPASQLPRVLEVGVDALTASPYQPRSQIGPEGIAELAASISRHGLLHPVIVRRGEDDSFELVAGERRLRAYKHLGRSKIPALVTTGDAQEISLIENLQREELHPLDEAGALARLMERHGYSHEMLADTLGRARSSVTEILAINTLPDWLQTEARNLRVARNLLVQLSRIADPVEQRMAWEAVKRGASVRELKDRRAANGKRANPTPIEQTIRLGQSFVRHLQKLPREQFASDSAHRKALLRLRDSLNGILGEAE